jgi:hypothetical protein
MVKVALAFVAAAGTLAPAELAGQYGGTVVATGLTNPRRVRFGPAGLLYVAEAGVGGSLQGTCAWPGNMFTAAGPYLGGYTGRVSRIRRDGTRETVADGLPSFTDGFGDSLGPTDIAWIGGTLYVLIEGGGCTRGLPNDPAGVVRINGNGTYTYVANITAFIRANPVAAEPLCGPLGDCEPDGVPHSMFAHGNYLYVVETNHNSVLRVSPSSGVIERLSDMSLIDPAPIVMTPDGPDFLIGAFDGLILSANRSFGEIAVVLDGFGPIVDITRVGNRLYLLETFGAATPWTPDTGSVVRVDKDGTRTVIASGLNFPIGMDRQGNDLYVSTVSYGQGPVPGLGKIVRIPLR